MTDYFGLLNKALDEGYITVKWTQLALSGPPGSGKSCFLKLLLGEPPPEVHNSTPVTTAPIVRMVETTGLMSRREETGQSWEKVDDQSLKTMIAQTLKERNLRGPIHEEEEEEYDEQEKEDDTFLSSDVAGMLQSVSTSSSFPNTSPAQNEIVELLPIVQESTELLQMHWIYATDSGGQAAFLDIAPALLRYNPVNILTLKLNEKLQDQPKFYFSIRGKQIGEPVERQMTHLQLLEGSFRSLTSRDSPTLPKTYTKISYNEPQLLVLGTFLDKMNECNESLDEKDAILIEKLEQYSEMRLDYRDYEDKIIYPINAIARGDDETKMASEIRSRICESYIEAEIPARWFLFKLDLDHFQQNTKAMIISKVVCLKIGKALKMDRGDVKAALMYYHDLTIFLYFPDVLPNVVFLHPQPLFDKLSELISISFADAVDYLEERHIFLPPGAHKKLKNEGIFHLNLLTSCLSSGFSNDFPPSGFLKLLESLFIVVPLPQLGEYFLPSVLPTRILSEGMKVPFMQDLDPLVLTWQMKPPPQGILPALVVNLLRRQKSPQFHLESSSSDNQQYRNAIHLKCIGPGGAVLLVDAIYWLEIYFSGHPTRCSVIRNTIYEGIKQVVEKFHYKPILFWPQEYFHCIMHKTTSHLCRPDEAIENLVCCKDRVSITQLDKSRQQPWFQEITRG